jgi:hypothetical protein
MKNHTKIYFDYFGYDKNSFIECEVCGAKAVDIHHIERRGMGGSKSADAIENIMALCRKHHEEFGDKKQWKEWLIKLHTIKLKK